jgi:hypothetical protein
MWPRANAYIGSSRHLTGRCQKFDFGGI